MKFALILILSLGFISCSEQTPSLQTEEATIDSVVTITEPSLIILGNVQDAGSPHIACKKDCCKHLFLHPDPERKVVSLGLIDPINKKNYLFEATPDISQQLKTLKNYSAFSDKEIPDAIFLTHAHIGHYTGLMYLGKEAMSANSIPVFVMPRMKTYLQQNGPWSQLVNNKNIVLQEMKDQKEISLSSQLKVIPFTVPHRDEFSETVGYQIEGPNKKALFIPDIDKWEKWETNIIAAIAKVDYAFIDASFFDAQELNNRNMTEIPHPFVKESMELFKDLPKSEKQKIYFIHFNHTNPLLNKKSSQAALVIKNGFNIARMFDIIKL